MRVIGEMASYRVYGDMGNLLWNEAYGADDPAFHEAVVCTMDLPEDYPEERLVFKPLSVDMAYGVYDGDEIVAIVFNEDRVK